MDETRDIAHYRNAVLIGRGGFGAVYRARDVDHGRDVAIKVLVGVLGDAERRRFDRERQTMGGLGDHPNIVSVHDSGYTEAGEAYIVMELANGGSLRERLDVSGPVPWSEAASIMSAIARAAQAAHDNGVLHRDIKPDNILIDQYGNPKLTDFGIAVVAGNVTATTSTTATLAHAAPEVLEGEPSTEAVDVYAIGSTLYNLILGHPPFFAASDESVTPMLTRILTSPPPDLRRFGVPEELADVAQRALSKQPNGRQSSAAELASELELAGGSPTASPPTASYHERPDSRPAAPTAVVAGGPTPRPPVDMASRAAPAVAPTASNRAVWIAVGGLLAAVVGLGALVVVLTQNRTETPDVADRPSDSATFAPTTSTVPTRSTTSTVATSSPITTPLTPATELLVVRSLVDRAQATVSSSSESGVDACGETTTFDALNLLDGRGSTAWRTPGDGSGEQIVITFDRAYQITSVGLVPGYAKVDSCDGADRFFENRRVVEVLWAVGSQQHRQTFDPGLPDLQTIDLASTAEAESVTLTIVEATDDGGRDFIAISEIEIIGG